MISKETATETALRRLTLAYEYEKDGRAEHRLAQVKASLRRLHVDDRKAVKIALERGAICGQTYGMLHRSGPCCIIGTAGKVMAERMAVAHWDACVALISDMDSDVELLASPILPGHTPENHDLTAFFWHELDAIDHEALVNFITEEQERAP